MSSKKTADDASVLARPIELASSLNQQVLDARLTGTKEALEALLHECDIVLECRLCRSMFRSLANFLSHKRIFCRLLYRDQKSPLPELVKPESSSVIELDNSILATSDVIRVFDPRKALESRRKGVPTRRPISLVQAVSSQSQSHRNVELKPLEGTSVAVSQFVAKEEVHTPLNEVKSEPVPCISLVEGRYPEGLNTSTPRFASAKPGMTDVLRKRTDCDVASLKCLRCNLVYASVKSLKSHMDEQHGLYKKVWVCPRCPNQYSKFFGVGKHMKNRHKASDGEIDHLKSYLKPKRFLRASLETSQNQPLGSSVQPLGSSVQPLGSSAGVVKLQVQLSQVQPQSADASLSGSFTMEDLSCELCEKQFNKIQYLNQHRVACTRKFGFDSPIEKEERAPVLYMCTLCNRAFNTRRKRENHVCPNKKASSSNIAKFECEFCDRTFNMVQHLNLHVVACRSRCSDTPESTAVTEEQASNGDALLAPNSEILEPLNLSDSEPSLSRSRPKRKIKRKTFPDHESSDVPEVVKVRQMDGMMCYKLRDDVIPNEEILDDSSSEATFSPKVTPKRRREISYISISKSSIDLDLMINVEEPLNITDEALEPEEFPGSDDSKRARGRPRKSLKSSLTRNVPSTNNKELSPPDENRKANDNAPIQLQSVKDSSDQGKRLEGLLSTMRTRKPLASDAVN